MNIRDVVFSFFFLISLIFRRSRFNISELLFGRLDLDPEGFVKPKILMVFFSIVEDGIMVQVSQERMLQIRKSLNNMEDCRIDCGPFGAEKPDETVYIKWIENDQSVNAG